MKKPSVYIVGISVFALVFGALLIGFTFVYVPKTIRKEYQAPKSSILLDEFFGLSPFRMKKTIVINLTAGDSLNIQVNVTKDSSGGDRVIDFSASGGATTFLSYSRITLLWMRIGLFQ